MEKIDLRKELKQFYSPKAKPEIVDIPEFSFLTYTGRGEPGGEAYQESINALYGAAYTLKFASKKEGRDFTVMPLEGLWWWDDPGIFNLDDAPPRETWNWTSMILVPDFVTEVKLDEIRPDLVEKKGKAVERVKLQRIHEGTSVQMLHVGPYSDEPRSQKLIQTFVDENGYCLRGHHHEIYMSDPRRAPPEKWRTILRHPVEKR
jgi:hypothetical protein